MKKLLLLFTLLFVVSLGKAGAITLTGHLTYNAGCDSQFFRLTASGYSATMRLITYFGDGTSKTDTFFSNTPYRCYTSHLYATPGMYTIKHVLTVSGVRVDSMSYSDTVGACRNMHITSFMDNNSNCLYDAGDTWLPVSFSMQIDSAGVHIDTLVGTSFNYRASSLAPVGTVYTFTVLTNPLHRHVTCPASGIIKDTLGTSNGQHRFGFVCDSPGFDLVVYGWFRGGVTGACAHVYTYNTRCTPQAATVTLAYSPKYLYNHVYPTSVTATSGSGYVTLNMGTPNPVTGCVVYFTPVGTPTLGDTTHTTWTVTPITGDTHPANNVLYRVDTIHTAYDPNDKAVTPEGLITSGTNLEYKIGFENMGSDTAYNIHVMDTLSDNLDINTLQLANISAEVYQDVFRWNGHNVIKFDLPNIRLLDTTHAGQNTGMIAFSIKTKSGLPDGTVITNRAGIYFDANPVVMTNIVYNTIGQPLLSTGFMSNSAGAVLYPNPVSNELTIRDEKQAYNSWELHDIAGRMILEGKTQGKETRINTAELAAGIYQVLLKNATGTKTFKLQRM